MTDAENAAREIYRQQTEVILNDILREATTIAFDPNAVYLILFDPDYINRMNAERIMIQLRGMGVKFTAAMVRSPRFAAHAVELKVPEEETKQ